MYGRYSVLAFSPKRSTGFAPCVSMVTGCSSRSILSLSFRVILPSWFSTEVMANTPMGTVSSPFSVRKPRWGMSSCPVWNTPSSAPSRFNSTASASEQAHTPGTRSSPPPHSSVIFMDWITSPPYNFSLPL